MNVRRLAAAAALTLCHGRALAADRPERGDVLRARDDVFARPEFALRDDNERSILQEIFEWVFDTLSDLHARFPRAYMVVVAVLALLVLLLVAHIVWTIAVARRARFALDVDTPELDLRIADAEAFRRRALQLAGEERFEEAVRELYTALLVTLDRRGDVTWARHKALLDYRHEARADDARAALTAFAGGYHPTAFGRRRLPRERFDDLVRAVDVLTPGRRARA